MTEERKSLVDELIADRRIEELRSAIQTELCELIDQPKVREVAARVYTRLAEAWGLSDLRAALLIEVKVSDVIEWRAGDPNCLDVNELEKISCLLGIYVNLATVYSGNIERIDRWLCCPNQGDIFRGRSAYDVLAGGSLNVFHLVRQHVAARTV